MGESQSNVALAHLPLHAVAAGCPAGSPWRNRVAHSVCSTKYLQVCYNRDNMEGNSEDSSQKVGRPLIFETVDELDMAIQNYFADCDPHAAKALVETGHDAQGNMLYDTRTVLTEQKPYTSYGLARFLKIDRKTLLNYKNRDQYFPSIQAALNRIAEYAESQLYGPYANGAKFSLTNNFKDDEWSDRKAVDHTTKGQPMPLLGGTVELPEADEGEGDGEVED